MMYTDDQEFEEAFQRAFRAWLDEHPNLEETVGPGARRLAEDAARHIFTQGWEGGWEQSGNVLADVLVTVVAAERGLAEAVHGVNAANNGVGLADAWLRLRIAGEKLDASLRGFEEYLARFEDEPKGPWSRPSRAPYPRDAELARLRAIEVAARGLMEAEFVARFDGAWDGLTEALKEVDRGE